MNVTMLTVVDQDGKVLVDESLVTCIQGGGTTRESHPKDGVRQFERGEGHATITVQVPK